MSLNNRFDRTRLLIGDAGLKRLQEARVAVFGLGGVGGYALEALARAGVGYLFLVDSDRIEPTNLNRQVLALEPEIGRPKVNVARERILNINASAHVQTATDFITPANAEMFAAGPFEYAVEAIDTISSKVALLVALHGCERRFVSCMGAARRVDPTLVRAADISQTFGCPLARRVRQRLAKEGIRNGVPCVFSSEHHKLLHDVAQIDTPEPEDETLLHRRGPQGSLSFVPGLIGLTAAGLLINLILQD